MLPSQVLIRYPASSWGPILDGSLFLDYEVQAGPTSWRPPTAGADLADARDALAARGYALRRSVLHAGTQGSRSNPTVHLDTWVLQVAKTEPPPKQAEAPSTDAATSAPAHSSTEPTQRQLRLLAGF